MSALSVRTIRRLDERSETREVRGVRIDKDIPIPPKAQAVGKLDAVLEALEVGESFEHTSRVSSRKAKAPGKKFTQRQIGPKKWRVWRIA
jgi:hypothetical protein